MTDTTDTADIQPDAAPTAAPAKKKRRRMPDSTKRLLLIILGILVLFFSVMGFYWTSDAFDARVPVLVSARNIEAGETVSAADFRSELVVVGSIPHIPWSPQAAFLFDGMVAAQLIRFGAMVQADMFIDADTAPVGVELEVEVPLDLTLATGEVADGDLVLLVDPGAEPVEGDVGRPRHVVRQFTLTNFDGTKMQLFLAPEEWAEWEAMLAEVGGSLMVVDLGVGADPTETAERLDAVWLDQWTAAAAEVAAAVAAAQAGPQAGPGELEVIVNLDDSLVPSGVSEGDLVLLIDPGAEPLGNDPGRPAKVIDTLLLENYSDGEMQMFVPPKDWLYWRSLADELGADPLVLPVADGTDVDDMSAQLDAEWLAIWERAVADAGVAEP